MWQPVKPGDIIGTLANWQEDADRMILDENDEGIAHLDLRLVENNTQHRDPSYLIIGWGKTYVP